MTSRSQITLAESWLSRLLSENRQRAVVDETALRKVIGIIWFRLCANSGPLGPWIFQTWMKSEFCNKTFIAISEMLQFILSVIWHTANNIILRSRDVN